MLPEGLTVVEDEIFAFSGLEELVVPGKFVCIEKGAFKACS